MFLSLLDCSQPSFFSYFDTIIKRTDRNARELDASAKQETWQGGGGDRGK